MMTTDDIDIECSLLKGKCGIGYLPSRPAKAPKKNDPNEVIAELQKVNEKEKKGGSGDSDVNVTEKDGTKSKTRNKNNNKKKTN